MAPFRHAEDELRPITGIRAPTRLRFDPVTCIVTIISAAAQMDHAPSVSVFDLGGQRVALRLPATSEAPAEHFADVHGAVLVVGQHTRGPLTVATVVEVGGEIVRGEGRARVLGRTRGGIRLHVEVMGDDGRPLLLDAVCAAVDDDLALAGA